MAFKFYEWAWSSPDLKPAETVVLFFLADAANDVGECWPSIPYLARKSKLSDRQVQRVIQNLKKKKYIEVHPRVSPAGDRTSNLYKMITTVQGEGLHNMCQVSWADVLKEIHSIVGTQSFHTWFQPARLISLKAGVLEIGVPNSLFEEYLREKEEVIVQAAKAAGHSVKKITVRVAMVSPKEEPRKTRK